MHKLGTGLQVQNDKMKPLCIFRYAFGYSRTLDHLRAWQFVLPKSVKEMVVSLTMDGIRREEDIGTKSEFESDTVFCSLQLNTCMT